MSKKSNFSRRAFMQTTAAAGIGATLFPGAAFAAGKSSSKRFLFIILRGAMDGIETLAPIGDAYLRSHRGRDIDYSGYRPVGNDFALHPALANIHALYNANDAICLPALAAPHRIRSHFDAQDFLEQGVVARGSDDTGWLARASNLIAGNAGLPIALSTTVPIVLRGANEVLSWAPSALPSASPDLINRLQSLYAIQGPDLATALDSALRSDEIAGNIMMGPTAGRQRFVEIAESAGNFLTNSNGPQLAVMELGGWDTHSNQPSQLTSQLTILDAAIGALRQSLDSVWSDTCIAVLSEFGRTVAYNGSNGSDHGTGGTGFLLGGAVNGGKIIGDWPGLRADQLFEQRDVYPANNAYGMIASVLQDHLGLSTTQLQNSIFGGLNVAPTLGLFSQSDTFSGKFQRQRQIRRRNRFR